MKINIEDILFMDNDNVVFTEGVDGYLQKHRKGEQIELIAIFHHQAGKYYARGGRHRAYMFYYRLGLRIMDVEMLDNFRIDEQDHYRLTHGGVTIKDLKEEHL